MSKRQLNSRIKDLFAELSDEPLVSQGQDTARLAGWTWEADGHGIYTAISPEIKSFLGYSGESLVGQPVTEGLEAGSDLNLQRALESSQFPAELQLNYLTNSGNFLATNIELFPIPWQPDEPFQREKNLGWRAIVHPAAPELPQHHRVEGQIEALNQAKAEKPEPRIRKKTPGISLPAAPGFPADWLNQPAAAPRGYLAEDQHVQHSQEILTDLGWQSLADNQPARRPAESGEQAILAFSTQLPDGNTSLLLELLDEDAGRDWNASERMLVEQVASQLTLALENAQLFQQTQNALAATSALYAASAAFSAAHSHAEILKALQQFSQLGQADKLLAIHYFDHPWSETQPALRSELLSGWAPSRSEIKQLTLRLDDPQSTQFLFADRITILNNLSPFNSKSDAITLLRDRFQLDTLVCIPLVTGGEWLGFVSAGYSAAVHFSAEDELRLMALSSQAAIAINNLQLLAETRQRNQELAAINRIVTAVAGSKDLQSSLGIIAAEMGISLKVQTGIALLNEERQVMTIVASYSPIPNAPEVIGIDLPIQGNPSTQQVLATRKTLVVEDAQHNPLTSAIHNELHLRSIESLMIIPLIVDERVIGTVGLDILEPSRHYTPDEIRLAETIVLQASTAIQSTRLFEQTELALAETETLYKASAEFNHAESYAQVLEILRRFTMVGHAATTSLLALFEEPQLIGYGPLVIPDWYLPIATWSASSAEVFTARRLPIQDFPAANELLKPDAPSILFDVENDLHLEYPARQIYSQRYQAKSVLFAPLVTGGHWIGFLGTFFNHPKALSNPDIRRLMVLTGQASVAIQNIRLLEESRRRADQLQTAAEVARDTSSTLALDALLLRVVNLLCDRFGYNHASVFLLDEDGIYAVVREATGEAGAEMKHRPHKLGVGSQSVIGTVTRNGLPLVINDVSHSSVHRPNPLLPDTRAELGIPLKIGQRVIGALDVQSNEINAFTPDDVAVLQVLADQIAVAVDNARAYMISQQAVEEMREVDRLKSQFLANMSHELRTPLNSIIGFSRVILKGIDGPLTDLQEQDLSAIYNSGQHLLNLINDVLDLSKIEAGKLELAFDDKVNLPDLINSVMSTVVGLVKDKPIQLTRNISANLPSVRADPTKIRQVLINLFSNA
ncbi:MAG TPA: GAF domain-containing protein, partial [Anaerolineales bacterium]|nr:GAF domain-containing protein [Anaerolineales bacterium]